MLSFVDLLFLAFGISLVVICAKRGLILTVIKFFKMLLSLLAARLWGGAAAVFVGEKFLNAPIRNSVYRKVHGVYLNTAEDFGGASSLDVLPRYLQTDAMREKLNGLEETGEALVESVTDTVAASVSSVVCGVIGFFLVFVLAFFALSLLYVVIRGAKKIFKPLGVADGICGGAFGFLFAWAVLLFAGSALRFFCGNQPIYTDSTVVKFFGDAGLAEGFRFLSLDQWLNKLLTSTL